MDINRYNTRVRQAISDEYVKCNKRRREIDIQATDLEHKLTAYMNGEIVLTYQEYIDVKSELNALHLEHDRLDIERGIWEQAREICLDIADEMDGG